MQNVEKIRPSRSSDVNSPVISASALLSLAQLFGHQLAGALLEQLSSRFLQMSVGAASASRWRRRAETVPASAP